jgi:hypothetical protein
MEEPFIYGMKRNSSVHQQLNSLQNMDDPMKFGPSLIKIIIKRRRAEEN